MSDSVGTSEYPEILIKDLDILPITQHHEFNSDTQSLSMLQSLTPRDSENINDSITNNEIPPASIIICNIIGSDLPDLSKELATTGNLCLKFSGVITFEHMEGMWVKVILLVVEQVNDFLNHSLEVFRDSDLKDNVILVVINDLEDNLSNEITYYKEFPVINVKSYQAGLKVLKRCIESKAAVYVPVYIKYPDEENYSFKQPINIIKEELQNVFIGEVDVVEIVTLKTTKTISKKRSYGLLGRMISLFKKTDYYDLQESTETDTVETPSQITKKYLIYHQKKLSYAETINGDQLLYKTQLKSINKIEM